MRSRLVLLALMAASCGNGVDDLSLPSQPLAVLRGHFDRSAIPSSAAGAPLHAALVWGEVPRYNLACVSPKWTENDILHSACQDPYGFVIGTVATEVLLPEGADSFELPLLRLPSASDTVGTLGASIAWGSVLVVADTDGNGQLEWVLSSLADPSKPNKLGDPVVAASFSSLHAPQQRVGFREGTWDPASTFYPLAGCEGPLTGFSILSTPGLLPGGLDPAPGACASEGFQSRVVEASLLSAVESKGMACRTQNRAPVRQPGAIAPGKPGPGPGNQHVTPGTLDCLDATTVAFIGLGDCPAITIYPLAGCSNDLACTTFDWDLRKAPPGWWPCGP